jgi:hypothetical protein
MYKLFLFIFIPYSSSFQSEIFPWLQYSLGNIIYVRDYLKYNIIP